MSQCGFASTTYIPAATSIVSGINVQATKPTLTLTATTTTAQGSATTTTSSPGNPTPGNPNSPPGNPTQGTQGNSPQVGTGGGGGGFIQGNGSFNQGDGGTVTAGGVENSPGTMILGIAAAAACAVELLFGI